MKRLTKLISVLLWLTCIRHSKGLQNVMQQPPILPELFGNNEQIMKNLNAQSPKFEAMPPFPPDLHMAGFPVYGMPFESNDYNLQYQQQYMPPIRLDIRFMPPPVYRFDATRPFMPLPPQMPAPYSFVLAPFAGKNKTTSLPAPTSTVTSEDIATNEDGTTKNKSRRAIGYRFAPRFYVVEDTETNVIDTWKDSNDYRYFSNRRSMNNGPNTRINFVKKDNLKQYKNKHVKSTPNPLINVKTAKGPELPKTLKNMVRIIPLKKEILREVTAKLKELKEQGKLSPFVEKLFNYEYDKHSTISKIVDIRTPLNEDRKKIV